MQSLTKKERLTQCFKWSASEFHSTHLSLFKIKVLDLISDLTNQKACERPPAVQALANSLGDFATTEETSLGACMVMSLVY